MRVGDDDGADCLEYGDDGVPVGLGRSVAGGLVVH
jgi:hypothetical protein